MPSSNTLQPRLRGSVQKKMKAFQPSALKEHTVIYVGGVVYCVRNRVEVSQHMMSGPILSLKYMDSAHCHPTLMHQLALCLL